jgi:MFS family permease
MVNRNQAGAGTGLVFAMYNIGSIPAVFLTGPVNDYYGRRMGMFTGACIIIFGTCIQAPSVNHGSKCRRLSCFPPPIVKPRLLSFAHLLSTFLHTILSTLLSLLNSLIMTMLTSRCYSVPGWSVHTWVWCELLLCLCSMLRQRDGSSTVAWHNDGDL